MLGPLIQIAVMSASQSVPPGGLGLALAGGPIAEDWDAFFPSA